MTATEANTRTGQPAAAAPGARVLVVDDDVTVRDVVRRYLQRAGYEVAEAGDGAQALRTAHGWRPHLVVLDLMLPGINGLEVCQRLRKDSSVPVIMLTALGEEDDRILGLQQGADDYIAKPFSPRELALRVGSVLRRVQLTPAAQAAPQVLEDGDLTIDVAGRKVSVAGSEVSLTGREFELLVFLLQHAGEAFDRSRLLSQVWGWEFGDQSTVTVHIRRLREKIEADPARPSRLVTVWGVGYRYERQNEG